MKQRDEALKGVNMLEKKISELSEKISRYDKEMEGKDSEKERLEADIARFTAHLKENEEILKGKEKEVKEIEDRLDTIQLDKENNLAERKMLESEKESQNQDNTDMTEQQSQETRKLTLEEEHQKVVEAEIEINKKIEKEGDLLQFNKCVSFFMHHPLHLIFLLVQN